MAKAPKRTTVADSKPLQSTPDDWMPLNAAFLHIQQVVGGEQLAEEELRLRLASGDVEAQDRWVTPGEEIDIIPLAPEDFQNGLLFPASPSASAPCTARRISVTTCCAALTGTAQLATIFSPRRADIFRVWPIGGEAKKPRKAALPTTRPKGIGPKVWLATNKVWELWSEGYRSPDREGLLRKVLDRMAMMD